jgi:transposase
MGAKRKQYTQEFKDSAVKLITEQGYKLSEASRSLGVNVSVLRRWRIASEAGERRSEKGKSSTDLQAELVQLKKENHRLKLEREILKKAAAFFAKESGSGID